MYSTYPAKFVLDSNGTYFVSFPDVPEAKTFVDDKSTANPIAAEALATALSFYVEAHKPLPIPSPNAARRKSICPPPRSQNWLSTKRSPNPTWPNASAATGNR